MSDEIGELHEGPGEMRYEWTISEFTSLRQENEVFYFGPKFLFSNTCWCLRIHPNGETEKGSNGWVGLYLVRIDSGPPKTINFLLGRKAADGKEEFIGRGNNKTFSQESLSWGVAKFLKFSDLWNRKTLFPRKDVLTVLCTLRTDAYQHTESSLFRRLWNLSLSLKNLLVTRKSTDVVLKLQDGEIPAHRIILESRSAVFSRMFGVDMRETQTGEVNIEDGDEETFKVVLSYAYSGEPEGLCSENVCGVYKAAHRYDLGELMKLCVDFMQKCLTVDTVCDVILLAHLYLETTLEECAKEYFAQHKTEVFKTAKWEKIKRENPAVGIEIVEYVFGNTGLQQKSFSCSEGILK